MDIGMLALIAAEKESGSSPDIARNL